MLMASPHTTDDLRGVNGYTFAPAGDPPRKAGKQLKIRRSH